MDLNKLFSKNISVFSLDIESFLSSFIDSNIKTENFFINNFVKKYGKYKLIKKGILGNKGDIIVDNVDNPKKFIDYTNILMKHILQIQGKKS